MKTDQLGHPGRHHPQRRAGGYALLLTLVMLALTGVTIGTLAHTSGSEALQARQAERDLQMRWAQASARRVLLPCLQQEMESELDRWRTEAQDTAAPPPLSVTVSIDLHGVRLLARLDDQQALPNLNQLLTATRHGQPRDVQSVLAGQTIRQRLVPMPIEEDTARRVGAKPYESWGQLYPAATPDELSGLNLSLVPPRGLVFTRPAATSFHSPAGMGLTLWGDGTLNVWTASPEALHQVLDDPIGSDQVAKLIDLRQDHRDLSARQLVQMMNLGPSERAAARLALTDRSETYALWLAAAPTQDGEPRPGERTQWTLTVTEGRRGISGGGGVSGGSGGRDRVLRW